MCDSGTDFVSGPSSTGGLFRKILRGKIIPTNQNNLMMENVRYKTSFFSFNKHDLYILLKFLGKTTAFIQRFLLKANFGASKSA